MSRKLLALGKGFYEKNWGDVAVPESVRSCFELSIHFPAFFSRELFLVAVHGWFAIQTNVVEMVYAHGTLTLIILM